MRSFLQFLENNSLAQTILQKLSRRDGNAALSTSYAGFTAVKSAGVTEDEWRNAVKMGVITRDPNGGWNLNAPQTPPPIPSQPPPVPQQSPNAPVATRTPRGYQPQVQQGQNIQQQGGPPSNILDTLPHNSVAYTRNGTPMNIQNFAFGRSGLTDTYVSLEDGSTVPKALIAKIVSPDGKIIWPRQG